MVSSAPPPPPPSLNPCPTCTTLTTNTTGVIASCLDCFLAGGVLHRFEYSTNPAIFLTKLRDHTCTLAASDPPGATLHRALYLLDHGFGCYNVFKNNCFDFAIYCKTGRIVSDKKSTGQSGQAASVVDGALKSLLSVMNVVNTSIYVKAASGVAFVVSHCVSRYSYDIGVRSDVVKVSVEDLVRMHNNRVI